MGWKNVKEHYRIEHHVAIEPEWDEFERMMTGKQLLCIGSSLCHDLITVNLTTWKFKKALAGPLGMPLQRIWNEMHGDLEKLNELLTAPDVFETSIPVFTFESGQIIELRCEALGWPNVTHDGRMMYANRFFADRAGAVSAGIRNAEARVENCRSWTSETERTLAKAKTALAQAEDDLEKLRVA
jgi:hypothetical protein